MCNYRCFNFQSVYSIGLLFFFCICVGLSMMKLSFSFFPDVSVTNNKTNCQLNIICVHRKFYCLLKSVKFCKKNCLKKNTSMMLTVGYMCTQFCYSGKSLHGRSVREEEVFGTLFNRITICKFRFELLEIMVFPKSRFFPFLRSRLFRELEKY